MTFPFDSSVNLLAVLVAIIANTVIGFLWYMPSTFGTVWMREAGLKKEEIQKTSMVKAVGGSIVSYVVTAFILAQVLAAYGDTTAGEIALTAFWLWLGFAAAIRVSHVLFEGKSFTYFAITAAHDLVSIVVMALIVGLWR